MTKKSRDRRKVSRLLKYALANSIVKNPIDNRTYFVHGKSMKVITFDNSFKIGTLKTKVYDNNN